MKTMHFFSAMAVGLCLAACSVRVFDSAEDLADSPNGISPSFAAAPPSPTKSPGGNFPALAYFKLTLPTGSAGNPDEVQPSVLKGSYQNSPYFHTGSDGAMVFWCPVNGVTTPGSTHPRTELRELMTGVNGDTSHNWKPGQFTKSRLMATVAVHRVPSGTLDVCIGQVHQFGNRPFVILHYKNGTVFARIYNTTNANTALTTLSFGNMALDTKFTYELLISATTIHVYVNGVHKTYPIDATWKTQDLYFKAGLYCLDGGTSSTDGGEAYFYSLSLYHGG